MNTAARLVPTLNRSTALERCYCQCPRPEAAAVWLPAPPGAQEALIETTPTTFVSGRGWLGIILAAIDDDALRLYIETAWELVAPKRLRASQRSAEHSEVPGEA